MKKNTNANTNIEVHGIFHADWSGFDRFLLHDFDRFHLAIDTFICIPVSDFQICDSFLDANFIWILILDVNNRLFYACNDFFHIFIACMFDLMRSGKNKKSNTLLFCPVINTPVKILIVFCIANSFCFRMPVIIRHEYCLFSIFKSHCVVKMFISSTVILFHCMHARKNRCLLASFYIYIYLLLFCCLFCIPNGFHSTLNSRSGSLSLFLSLFRSLTLSLILRVNALFPNDGV